MSKNPFVTAIAVLLTITLVAPSAFLFAPQPVHAQQAVAEVGPNLWTNIKTTVESTISVIEETITAITGPINTAANVAQKINTYYLQPLAFVLSGNLMKMLTASVIQFVIGKANGTGVPQFVVDVNRSLQTVGDSQALAYLRQFGTNSNSPFSASIASALKNNYLSKTSLAGFWAANMNTLARTSPNVPAFLSGRWSQGGVAAWFALTTQVQNNPYTFYQNSQAQMAGLVGAGAGGATGARLATLSYGSGFMSWCGSSDATTQANATAVTNAQYALNDITAPVPNAAGKFYDSNGNTYLTQAEATKADMLTSNAVTANNRVVGIAGNGAAGVNPGDPCMNKDGTAGTIKTPGSVIKSTLDKVLGGQQDIVTRMGNVGPQITSILGNIATVMQTVQFASQILGSASLSGATGGLLGADSSSAANSRSALENFTPTQNASGAFTSGYLGASNTSIYNSAATDGSSGSDKLKLITDYQSAWNTIGAVANVASVAVTDLANFCTTASGENPALTTAATAQAAAARLALTTEINPVLAQAASAAKASTDALAMVQKVQIELSSGSDSAGSTYATDIQTLQTMPPTASDFANAQQDAQAFGGATASPVGSLSVSGGSLVDQMNLIGTNAAALKIACTPVVVDTGGG